MQFMTLPRTKSFTTLPATLHVHAALLATSLLECQANSAPAWMSLQLHALASADAGHAAGHRLQYRQRVSWPGSSARGPLPDKLWVQPRFRQITALGGMRIESKPVQHGEAGAEGPVPDDIDVAQALVKHELGRHAAVAAGQDHRAGLHLLPHLFEHSALMPTLHAYSTDG